MIRSYEKFSFAPQQKGPDNGQVRTHGTRVLVDETYLMAGSVQQVTSRNVPIYLSILAERNIYVLYADTMLNRRKLLNLFGEKRYYIQYIQGRIQDCRKGGLFMNND